MSKAAWASGISGDHPLRGRTGQLHQYEKIRTNGGWQDDSWGYRNAGSRRSREKQKSSITILHDFK